MRLSAFRIPRSRRRTHVLACASLALVLTGSMTWANMLAGRHNLATGFTSGTSSLAAEQEVCIFCHTPQGGSTRTPGRPTWIPSDLSALEFRVFDPLDPGQWPALAHTGTPVIGYQSFVCLSCHDGTQAELAGGRATTDHPIGVPYRGAAAASALVASGTQVAMVDELLPEYRGTLEATVGGARVWWVSTTGRALRSKNDLPLYTRADPLSGATVPVIECSTCHDPHSTNPRFLRVAEGPNGLCMTCHIK